MDKEKLNKALQEVSDKILSMSDEEFMKMLEDSKYYWASSAMQELNDLGYTPGIFQHLEEARVTALQACKEQE